MSGERGLCGAFNSNVIRRAVEFLREHSAQNLEVIVARPQDPRRHAQAALENHGRTCGHYHAAGARARPRRSRKEVIAALRGGEIDAVYIVFNEFKSVLSQNLTLREAAADRARARSSAGEESHEKSQEHAVDYLYEQPPG